MHIHEINNLAYIACYYGHNVMMDESLFNKIRLDVGRDPQIQEIVDSASAHVWRLKGKPDRIKYKYDQRIAYAMQVARTFMETVSPEKRQMPQVAFTMSGAQHKSPVLPRIMSQ